MNTRRDILGGIAASGVASTVIARDAVRNGVPGVRRSDSGPFGFQYFVGIVGNPSAPEIEWSDQELRAICDLGVNMLQLNIAWGGKPAGEVLNLEDLNDTAWATFANRSARATKFGCRSIVQFGIPRALSLEPVQPACILNPEVRADSATMLAQVLERLPHVADVLVYTFDQQAWLCSEYGPCPRCSGLPLHERLSDFLNHLQAAMRHQRADSRLWWKPWELSKGQTETVLTRLEPSNIGLVLNPSTSNEVYPFNDRSFRADLGIKRLVRIASDRGIPVLGEFDHTLYKGLYLIADGFPRLVHEQIQGWRDLDVVGIKEYYGFAPSQFSVNAAMLRACFKHPHASLEQLLASIAAPYGARAVPSMLEAWEGVAQAVEAFPWDITYLIGGMGLDRHNDGSHGWEPKTILNATWNTPIWKSNRRANFMLTEDFKAEPWLFEDAGLRLESAAALYYEAVTALSHALSVAESRQEDIRQQRDDALRTARALRGTSLHLLETLAAQSARLVLNDPQQFEKVRQRLEGLLVKDVDNQRGDAAVSGQLAAFRADPRKWLSGNLKPKAYESTCSIDWSRYVPFQAG